VFWIDADERASERLSLEIRQAVEADRQDRVYEVPRLSWVFGRYIRHSGWYPDYVVRLYARNRASYDDALVHEKVIVPAGLSRHRLTADLIHYTYENLHHYLTKSARYGQLWADQKQLQNKDASLLQAVLHGLGCFIKMYLLKRGFLDGKQGFLLAVLSSHSSFIKYADLWIRRQKKKDR
jgi:(heptosyl)LPS beta-1,4-glucosyltransferase